MTINDTTLQFNKAHTSGGVLCSLNQTKLIILGDNCTFVGNQAHRGGVIYASESKVDVHCQSVLLANNTATDTGSGGAVYLSKTYLTFFNRNSMLTGNRARDGGAIYASKSKMLKEMYTLINSNANLAEKNGGGLYLMMSELKIRGNNSFIAGNRANKRGGGLHAVNSSIIIESTIQFTDNQTENGGVISLEKYAKLTGPSATAIILVGNKASHHGGALFVDDKTNPDMCTAVSTQNATSTTECFSSSVFFNFFDNYAGVSGSSLFGGLLDRCRIHTYFFNLGVASFQRYSNINESQLDTTVSSYPVRMCFCRDSQPDCNYQPEPIQVGRWKTFTLELIAYDQVNHTISATIDCSLNSSVGGLNEDQVIQHINQACTNLQFSLFSPLDLEDLMQCYGDL